MGDKSCECLSSQSILYCFLGDQTKGDTQKEGEKCDLFKDMGGDEDCKGLKCAKGLYCSNGCETDFCDRALRPCGTCKKSKKIESKFCLYVCAKL